MKQYIQAATRMQNGSYVVDRDGNILDIGMHVPSTTYHDRGIFHLSVTDADFLLNQSLISEDEATAIILYNFAEWVKNEKDISDEDEVIPLTALLEFRKWAETSWAKTAQTILFKQNLRTLGDIQDKLNTLPDFDSLNSKWYTYLKQNYCKISKYGNAVEFRIGSDGFNWNPIIIDKVILKYDSGRPYSTRYTVMIENEQGYKMILDGVTLEDILNNDKVVMASERNGKMKKRFVAASKKVQCSRSVTLEEWCKTLSSKIHTLYLHYMTGEIIGKMPVKQAVATYGEARVTSSYSEGDGVISVWIIE